jgi:ribosomal protein S18 acetylase RimI-like enzyme
VDIRDDRWLANLLGHEAFRVVPGDPAGDDALTRHAGARDRAFYYAKVDAPRIDLVERLAALGFVLVETNLALERVPAASAPVAGARAPGVIVVDLDERMHAAVLDIAGSAFRYSRFHADPRIPHGVAHLIKREWIGSYVRKERGEALLVALAEERPAGFLAVMTAEVEGRRTAIIDLVAVDQAQQGRGIGRALVRAFVERWGPESERLRVHTQLTNLVSLNLYRRSGFALASAQYVLHRHVARGDA